MVRIIRYDKDKTAGFIKQTLKRTLWDEDAQNKVNEIISDVKKNKDAALFKYTKMFDGADINTATIKVTENEIEAAYSKIDSELLGVMKKSAERIRGFHEKQKQNSWLDTSRAGEILGQMIRPLERVGVYVPGGKAAYPSSVLMNIIPAAVAGVPEIIMATPCGKDGTVPANTIAAADIAGAAHIYKAGGAQAIAALAFGTESIPKVDKIAGPGNIYVALAKKSVYGHVNIDSVAGPSEILIIADETANEKYIAADLLSQAEHDELASSILITTSNKLAEKVLAEIELQTAALSRKEIIEKSLTDFGMIVLTDSLGEAVNLSNDIAPEHLEICTENPFELLTEIKNAGAVFLGNHSPEPLGDYMAGPNHVLPTGGTARFFSPLSVDDYVKKSSIIHFSGEALKNIGPDVVKFAQAEGLTAHANSIKVRL